MSDLTDRMRTCAAMLAAEDFTQWRIYENETQDRLVRDVEALLIEAADELEKPIEVRLGEPMAVIPVPAAMEKGLENLGDTVPAPGPAWGGGPPSGGRRSCPNCQSRAGKRVRLINRSVWLVCSACGHEWPYVADGEWK